MPMLPSGHDATVSRVLMVTTSPERRGAEVFASTLADELDARGHSCTVMAVRPTTSDRPLPVRVAGRSRWDPVGLARLTRAAAAHDVVVGHGSVTLIAGAAIAAGARRPFIYRSIGDPEQWGDVRLASLRVRRPMRRAAAVVALYDRARGALIDRHGLPPGRVRVIPNAVDADGLGPVDEGARATARARLGLDDGIRWVGYLGALSAEKRPEVAVRVIAATAGTGLVVAGDGPLRARTERLAAALAPGRTRFLGAVDHPRELLDAVEGLLLPSRTEGIPAAAIEAGMCGLPVVASAVGGLVEVIDDGRTGRLVATDGDDGAGVGPLQEALLDALAHAVPMGGAARERCLSRYSMAVVADSWSALVDEVVNHPSGGRARRGT